MTFLVATVLLAWTPVGRSANGRAVLIALLAGSTTAIMMVMVGSGGGNPVSVVFGAPFAAATVLMAVGTCPATSADPARGDGRVR